MIHFRLINLTYPTDEIFVRPYVKDYSIYLEKMST